MFVLRVQTSNGTKRLSFPSVTSTWAELQEQIKQQFGIPMQEQRISLEPLHQAKYVTASSDQSFAVLDLHHGDLLYLQLPTSTSQPSSQPVFRPTEKCQHGPKGRCLLCSSAPADYRMQGVCNHGKGVTCTNCSEHVQSKTEEVAEWLCNHSEDAFCFKCLPPEDPVENKWNKTCSCSRGQKCSECINQGAVYKVDLIPYAQMMAEKRAVCRFKHDSSTLCHLCAPPRPLSYTGKHTCDSGHRPWPLGICARCAPPNAVVSLQNYRHCDGISWKDTAAGNKFVGEWQANPGLQRAALLFGKYIAEPEQSKNTGAVRAEVYSLYCPPQEHLHDGVRFLRNPQEKQVLAVAKALDLEPVGWAITTLPRAESKHGPVFLSGREVRQAARFQAQFSDELGHSRFVTMVVQYNAEGEVEPKAFQISDQGMAMERDGVLGDGSSMEMVSSRKGKDGEYVPSVIYKNRPLAPGEDFLPDELLVKVIPMKPYRPAHKFEYLYYPFENASEAAFKGFLSLFRDQEPHRMFSDFNALVYLPRVVGIDLALSVARAVHSQQALSSTDRVLLEKSLSDFM